MMTAMPKLSRISLKDVEFMPPTLAPGVLYVSTRFKTAAHLCACGCGTKVVTSLKPGGWLLTRTRGEVPSLEPSVGNFNLPCQSHYFIRAGKIAWAPPWTPQQIAMGRSKDHELREAHFAEHQSNWWRSLSNWIKSMLHLD